MTIIFNVKGENRVFKRFCLWASNREARVCLWWTRFKPDTLFPLALLGQDLEIPSKVFWRVPSTYELRSTKSFYPLVERRCEIRCLCRKSLPLQIESQRGRNVRTHRKEIRQIVGREQESQPLVQRGNSGCSAQRLLLALNEWGEVGI